MSDLTFLVAESLIVLGALISFAFVSKLVKDTWAAIVTGVLEGTPVSPRVREAMLFSIWVPFQWGLLGVSVILALIHLEMVDHVTNAGLKLVAQGGAFLAAIAAAFQLLTAAHGLFSLRAKVHRDERRQAETD
jgi:hypothetical protein